SPPPCPPPPLSPAFSRLSAKAEYGYGYVPSSVSDCDIDLRFLVAPVAPCLRLAPLSLAARLCLLVPARTAGLGATPVCTVSEGKTRSEVYLRCFCFCRPSSRSSSSAVGPFSFSF